MNTNQSGVFRSIKLPSNYEKVLVKTEDDQWRSYDNLVVTVTSPRPFCHTPRQLRALSRMVASLGVENNQREISSNPRTIRQ